MEVLAPTAYAEWVKPELIQVDKDAMNGNDFQAFADIQTLGQTLFQEAEYTVYWGFPSTSALLGYSQVVSDLETVGALKEIRVAFLDDLASKIPSHSASSTPAVWTAGRLGNGSSSGVRIQTSQTVFTGYSSTDLSDINAHLNALNGEISSNDLWEQEAQQVNPDEGLDEDEYDESYDPDIDPEMDEIDDESSADSDPYLGG